MNFPAILEELEIPLSSFRIMNIFKLDKSYDLYSEIKNSGILQEKKGRWRRNFKIYITRRGVFYRSYGIRR